MTQGKTKRSSGHVEIREHNTDASASNPRYNVRMPEPLHQFIEISATSFMGGPSWKYRGAVIHSNRMATLFNVDDAPAGLPGIWHGVGNRSEIQRIVDAWLDTGKLASPYRMPIGKAT